MHRGFRQAGVNSNYPHTPEKARLMRIRSLFVFEFIEPGAACFHVFLPSGISWIELRQPFGNFKACFGVDNRVRPTLLLRLELRNLIRGYKQIALPLGVAGSLAASVFRIAKPSR